MLTQLEEHKPDPFTCGVLALLSAVVSDDRAVAYRTAGRDGWDALLVTFGGAKFLVGFNLGTVVPYDEVRHRLAAHTHDFSALASATVLALFERAVRSRGSPAHLLAVRAVGAALRNPAFLELASTRIDAAALTPFCGSLGAVDHLIAQWRAHCRSPVLAQDTDAICDRVCADRRHFAILLPVRADAAGVVTARHAAEVGIAEESGDDALFAVLNRHAVSESGLLSVAIDTAGFRINGLAFVAPEGSRWRCFFAGDAPVEIDVPPGLLQGPAGRFMDRCASGRFGLRQREPLLQLPQAVLDLAGTGIAQGALARSPSADDLPIDRVCAATTQRFGRHD
jgi:hypothetical protein